MGGGEKVHSAAEASDWVLRGQDHGGVCFWTGVGAGLAQEVESAEGAEDGEEKGQCGGMSVIVGDWWICWMRKRLKSCSIDTGYVHS